MRKSRRSSENLGATAGSESRPRSVRVEYTPPPSQSPSLRSIHDLSPVENMRVIKDIVKRLSSSQSAARDLGVNTAIVPNLASALAIWRPDLTLRSTPSAASIAIAPSPSRFSGRVLSKREIVHAEPKKIKNVVWQSEVVSAVIRSEPTALETGSLPATDQGESLASPKFSKGALDRVSAQRLIVKILRDVERCLVHFLFEPTDANTYEQVTHLMKNYLGELLHAGAIHNFVVVCDDRNNWPTYATLNVDLAVKLTPSSEFIYLPVRVTPTETE